MVTVKRIAGGIFSNWVGDNLKAGDTVEVMPPHGSFTTEFDATAKRHIVGIAGGSGITPVMSLLKTTLRRSRRASSPCSTATATAARSSSWKVADLKDRYLGRLSLHHFLAEEEGDIDLFNGMLDRARCDEAIAALVGDPAGVDAWFICGPGPMMDAAEGALLDRNVDKERIHIERFTADRPSAALARGDGAAPDEGGGQRPLSVTLDGRTRRVAFTRQHPRQRPRVRASGAVRLQGRRLRDLPGQGHQRQSRNGGSLRPDRRRGRRRLRPDLPVRAGRRRGRSGLRRLDLR